MSGVLIIKPEQHGAFPVAPGTGASNLLTSSPKEVWVAPSTASLEIFVDLGAAVAVDSFFMGHTNATTDATWTIYSRVSPSDPYVQLTVRTMRAADSLGPRHHAFVRIAAPVTSRYFSIIINQGGVAPLYAGSLILGRAFEKHREYGPGRNLIDTGTRQDLPDGGFGMGDGVVKAQFAFSFVDLTDAEKQQLWGIKKDRGLRRPVLVVEDADLAIGQNEAIHYGVFERFQAYEATDPMEYRWAGSVIDWE